MFLSILHIFLKFHFFAPKSDKVFTEKTRYSLESEVYYTVIV